MERILFKKVELWVVLLLIIFFFVTLMYFGDSVRRATIDAKGKSIGSRTALAIAQIPEQVRTLWKGGLKFSNKLGLRQQDPRLLDGDYLKNFHQVDEKFVDDGYLLVSAYSDEYESVIVYLYDLQSHETVHTWMPRPDLLVEADPTLSKARSEGKLTKFETPLAFRAQHPLLLDDGSIVVSSGEGSLSRWSMCNEIVWVNGSSHFHHSIERQGENLIVPIVVEDNQNTSDLQKHYRNDGYAIVDLEHGRIKEKKSILSILEQNELSHVVYGLPTKKDAIHLNDAEIVETTDTLVMQGDIMFSSRHLSAVFLYRPSSGEVIWYKSGPWLAQHDIDYLGDGNFSIYGNDNALVPVGSGEEIVFPYGYSTIYTYDMVSGDVQKPYRKVIEDVGIKEHSFGRHRILSNGDVFIDAGNIGTLLRLSKEKVRWKYVHRTSGGIGATFWSRYLQRNEVNLSWRESRECRT